MSAMQDETEFEKFRFILISNDRECFFSPGRIPSSSLPELRISKGSRPAAELTRLVWETWGIDCLVVDLFHSYESDTGLVFAEAVVPRSRGVSAADSQWSPFSLLKPELLSEAEHIVITQFRETGTTSRGPLARLGFFHETLEWLTSELPQQHFSFSGEVTQLNCTATFALMRLGNTRGPAVWLKAVGEPNLNEYAVTLELSDRWSAYLPGLLISRSDWHAWVAEEAGARLSEPVVMSELRSATARLAQLQVASSDSSEYLRRIGCFDHRIGTLQLHLPKLTDYIIEAMSRQTSTKVERLSVNRVRELGDTLYSLCEELRTCEIPDTLIHNDFTLGNILTEGNRCVFIDWAEASVGCPLFTYQHLRAYLLRDRAVYGQWLPILDDIYSETWAGQVSRSVMKKALNLSAPIAMASYLVGRSDWLYSSDNPDPNLERLARNMARHISNAMTEATLQ